MTKRNCEIPDRKEVQEYSCHDTMQLSLEDIVREKIRSRCEKLAECIEKKYTPDEEALRVLRSETERLVKVYHEGCQPHLKTIYTATNKFVHIPDNVLLNEDKSQAVQYTEEEFEKMKSTLENLQKRTKRATILNAALKQEMEDLEQFKDFKCIAERLCNVIENAIEYPQVDMKIAKLQQAYLVLDNHLKQLKTTSYKEKHNPKIDNNELESVDLFS
ncbi:uncharacterized protein LOC107271791 isoform X2 [Cephus cinctus]|uniref:Uncharacterized protein LOC107271791 isoform X2 n=1 Tax=Cephus cinctus TaxID=211228 RepID=A0AAJ7FQU8_CEPCN|nr:uncharacterized protein LOC107271791 isoform X2 [Cephus cinctus]